ncbi:SusD/RagB family nutrient-binding outer membrane lipoprotein [Chitinophaga ginsengisoli]|uniref:SusD-like starch-binding protein associating with outer membrane n=1 Tax=Chitinophaga ginsengisoli TaxID=363837 RepID=A0A2P8GMQ7_9BACT|nr:SusD/RagB family nutrient-binding outer membrane lipoprotein [Chitinophaga ginsengisoli]PSL35250.1 SusD-like starch-binding protein associating with outer membrane [Chitinophaga ginsengisoli]
MMKRNIIKSAAGLLTVLSLTITGCSNFLDINDNPNKAETGDPNLVLPSAQAAIAQVVGCHFQIYGGIWNQYWTQNFGNSQYKSVEQYLVQGSDFDRPWQTLYADAMTDLQMISEKAGEAKFRQYAAIALILKAYDLQLLTDAFGDIPMKEALQGESKDSYAPHYDAQAEVYDSIFAMIDRAKGWIDPESAFLPGPEDLIFGGDMDQWTRFANTLKLRAYLRLAYVNKDKAQAGITALQGAEFLTESAQIDYISTGGNNNPLYAELYALGQYRQLRTSNSLFKQMQYRKDPRIDVYFQIISGVRRGMDQASYDIGPNGSTPATIFGADPLNTDAALAPVKFISAYESYFLQAEAVARGWLTGNTAAGLFQQGIQASFDAYHATPGTYITTQVAGFPATGVEAQVDSIITQKYFAMALNQNFEAWTEWRRTGYPKSFFVKPVTGTLPANTYPSRFLYPNTELTRNPNFPGAKVITDKVWWDTKD